MTTIKKNNMVNRDSTVMEERNMAGKIIGNTYKGILRISNNIDIIENERDSFLNDEYYLPTNSDAWSGDGVQQTHNFLSENSSIKRFKSEDEYLNLKIPVTDSVGNYLNFSLGINSSLIGSDTNCGIIKSCKEQFNSADNDTHAALISEEITLGRSKQPQDKIVGANLNINSSNISSAKLAVVNKKRHSGDSLISISSPSNVRTIYDVTKPTPQKYDSFFYNQENYEENENYKDCKVTLQNLKQYIYDQITQYLQTNTSPVPTGTIVSQYCNLDKWYCWSNDNGFDDIAQWQGYRPAMINSPDAPYSYYNTIQGKFLRSKTFLYYNDDNGSFRNLTSEMPPDFKRGYVLCDGGPLTIYLTPYWEQSRIDKNISLDLLLDLFHSIGYYYYPNDKNIPIHNCILDNGKYSYENDFNYWKNNTKVDGDVCYGISMSTILAFKELNNKFSLDNVAFNGDSLDDKLEKCLEWLGTQPIPEKYIFNILIPTELTNSFPNSYFKYTDSNNNIKNYINIGRQISSFGDEIPYYKYDTSTNSYSLTTCKIIDTAEVRDIARLLINKLENQNNWDRYYFTFYLPKLYTYTDTDVNEAYKYIAGGDTDISVSIGQFIGSNGNLIADEIIIPHLNQTIIPSTSSFTYNSLYRHSYGYNAHNHALAIGNLSFHGDLHGDYYYHIPSETDNNGSRIASLTIPERTTYNKISDTINNENVVAADYHHSFDEKLNKSLFSTYLMDNYIFQDVPDETTDNNIVYSMGTGSVGYELLHEDPDNFKWYGRSSEPLWAEHDVTAKTLKHNKCVGYFTPESIKVMPLIKL